MDYLCQHSLDISSISVPDPGLILLDLNMPKKQISHN
jgi:hypothetical protein